MMLDGMVPVVPIVAAVQFAPRLLDVRQNIATAQQLSYEAAAKGARIIVLPEMCMSGITIRDAHEAVECAQDSTGYQTEAILEITSRFRCHVVFGYIELSEGKLYSSAAIVGPHGIVGNVQKHNLYGSDNLWATPSEKMNAVVVTELGRLGALICRDSNNEYRKTYPFYDPNHRFYRKGSVDIIALLTNWGKDYAYPASEWVNLVEETGANVIVSNRVGDERDMEFKGGSAIIMRDGTVQTFGSSFISDAIVGGIVML